MKTKQGLEEEEEVEIKRHREKFKNQWMGKGKRNKNYQECVSSCLKNSKVMSLNNNRSDEEE